MNTKRYKSSIDQGHDNHYLKAVNDVSVKNNKLFDR